MARVHSSGIIYISKTAAAEVGLVLTVIIDTIVYIVNTNLAISKFLDLGDLGLGRRRQAFGLTGRVKSRLQGC
jgi:hypothetical protein